LSSGITVRRLRGGDTDAAIRLNALFAEAFADPASYEPAPDRSYFADILGRDEVVALVAETDDELVGGLVAYVLPKLEQERSEIYLYDLAVAEHRRRQGIATALIDELGRIASAVGAWVIFVQADYGDEPAIALYEKLGTREDVMHFDIAPARIR
jgi:ribosomal protein S18 acetylase RimI-like enzyme